MIEFNTINQIIEEFYKKATFDFMIGYHFRRIDNFKEHIPHIARFWEVQLTGRTDYQGKPFELIKKHRALGIKKAEIGRWMILFKETIDQSQIDEEIKDLWWNKALLFKKRIETTLFQT